MTTSDEVLLDRAIASTEPADDTSRRVLDAALTAFLDFGIRRTSMNEIAKRAGLGVATVYRRYPQKDQLVEAVILREAGRFVAEVDRRVGTVSSATDIAVEGFVAVVVGIREHPLLRRLLVTEPEIVLPMLTLRGGPVLAVGRGYLAGVIRRLRADGAIPDCDPEPVAELLARIAHSLLLTPDGCIPGEDDEATRRFARSHVAPILTNSRD
ncbi:MAG TPA: TetR/AcrR family transcriptional regulator [Pseudonocardiaceae bacterium]